MRETNWVTPKSNDLGGGRGVHDGRCMDVRCRRVGSPDRPITIRTAAILGDAVPLQPTLHCPFVQMKDANAVLSKAGHLHPNFELFFETLEDATKY